LTLTQPRPRGPPHDLPCPAQQTLDAEEIAFRMMCRQRDQESTVAAAEVDFERTGCVGEDFFAAQPPEIVRWIVESGWPVRSSHRHHRSEVTTRG
jgi:hypothetical protein